jgi:hypothetical protein
LLSAQNFIEPIYNFAPGEGNIPVSVFLEKDAEGLGFLKIFCGERRPTNAERPVKVSYG